MKYLLTLLISINLWSVELNHKYIQSNYKALTNQQIQIITQAYQLGQLLIIDGESYGYTLATFAFVESSAGRILTGDSTQSFGLSHIQLTRARELLPKSAYYSGLNSLSDIELANKLTFDNQLNLVLCGINFKLNLMRWNSYSRAIRAHNGFAPSRSIYNQQYYNQFINAMQIVKLVIKDNK